MASTLEFREDYVPYKPQYDFVVDNPAILTVEVGTSKPGKKNKSLEKLPIVTTSTQRQFLRVDELDSLLKHYENLLQKSSNMSSIQSGPGSDHPGPGQHSDSGDHQQPTISQQESPPNSAPPVLSIEKSENTRLELFDNVNQSFEVFLNYVQHEAKDYAKVLFKNRHFDPLQMSRDQLLQLLRLSPITTDEWRRKLHEIQESVKLAESQNLELKQLLDQDLKSQPSPSVSSHIANAINSDLDQCKTILTEDVNITYHAQQYKNNLLKKLTTSYVTFYSWMLEQWNRNIQKMNQAYGRMYERIGKIWEKDQLNKDIEQLLNRYEAFLKAHEKHLPMEFTLSMNPRKEWREFMAKQQPEECIRFMKNELQALNSAEVSPDMKKSLDIWKHELGRYNTDRIQTLNKNRQQIRKRIEDAIETETHDMCVKRWAELIDRIYKMGTDLQTQALVKIKEYDAQFDSRHQQLLSNYTSLQRSIASYEGRLALVDKPWATWMEQRKGLIRAIAQNNYWQVSIASLIEVSQIVNDFRDFIESRQQSKIEM